MKILRCLLLAGLMMFPVAVAASPCGTSGMTVVKADDGANYVLYVFREGPDAAFQLPGKGISFPEGTSGRKMFNLDGVLFETLFAKTTDFIKPGEALSDLEILRKHRDYEFDFLKKTPSPLTKLVELGPRERAAGGGQPSFTFYLWQVINPSDPKGTSQYFLTNVSAGEVAVLSAIVPTAAKEGVAMQAFQGYAASFQHILRKEQCPESKKN